MRRFGIVVVAGVLFVLPVVARAQVSDGPEPIAFVGGTVVVSPDNVIESATIVVRDGRVVAVGKDVDVPPGAERIDAKSLVIYAGFIDAHSRLGLPEHIRDEAARRREEGSQPDVRKGPLSRTREAHRKGIHAELRAERLFDADEDALKAHRQGGFTTVLTAPPGILGGQSAIVNLSGAAKRSAVLRTQTAQHASFRPDDSGRYPRSLMGIIALFRQVMLDAEHHATAARLGGNRQGGARLAVDPGLDALADVLAKRRPLVFQAASANQIHRALNLAEEFGVDLIIAGGREAWKVADRLEAADVPVLANLDFGDEPEYGKKKKDDAESKEGDEKKEKKKADKDKKKKQKREPLAVAKERRRRWEERVANLIKLREAGVRTAVATAGMKPGDVLKNLRLVIERGLPVSAAIDLLTRRPAQLFGLDAQLGTLEAGKLANLTVLTHALDHEKAKVKYVVVDGRKFEFDVPEKKKPDTQAKTSDGKDGEQAEGDQGGSLKGNREQEAEADDDEEEWPTWASEIAADRVPVTRTGGNVLVRGGTVLTVTRGAIENAAVLIRNGKIEYVGTEPPDVDGVTVIDASGLYVVPGIIDCHSHIAIEGGVNEGSLAVTAECRIADVVDPETVSMYRAVAGGTTCANLLHGSANPIGGQNAVIKLKYGRPASELFVPGAPQGIKFALGENVKQSNSSTRRGRRFPDSRMGVEMTMRRSFEAAKAYGASWQRYADDRAAGRSVLAPRRDLRLEALGAVLRGDIIVHCHCYRADEILRLLGVAEDYGFRIATLQHVLEGYKVAPEMARHGCGGSTFADMWSYKLEAYDAVPHNAWLMQRAGVNASVNSDSGALIRLMNMQAAIAMRYGRLRVDEALALVTINPARQLGIESKVGSIEVGKDGDLALFTAHPLDTFSRCVATLIEGEVYFEDADAPRPEKVKPFPAKRRAPERLARDAGTYAIVGAEIHPVTSPVIERGTVLIHEGKIAAVGRDVEVPATAVVVDAEGLKVYPGMIDAGSVLGLSEIGSIYSSQDDGEIAGRQPDARAISAVHPDSIHIESTRLVGITTALTHPTGGEVAGRSAVIDLDGWTALEMARVDTFALHLRIPRGSGDADERDEQREKAIKELKAYFDRALRYAAAVKAGQKDGTAPPRDLTLEALVPYARGKKPVVVHANDVPTMRAALAFAKDAKLKLILSDANDAWKIADEIAKADVPVILGSRIWQTPRGEYEPFDALYAAAARLHEAGVKFCFRSGSASKSRYVPYDAAISVAYGLPAEAGLRAVTQDAADILGVGDQIGSIDVGKAANLMVCTANPLQVVNDVVHLFIRGEPVTLESKQTRQARKYEHRPAPTLPARKQLVGLPSQTREPQKVAAKRATSDAAAQ